MDWEIFPQGLVDSLERINRDFAPAAILITESGASFPDNWDGNANIHDYERTEYLHQHVQSVGLAINKGIPVRGYFVWSLLDNYEWSQGFSKRFGLIYIDYPSLKHVIKNSGYWYKAFISSVQNNNRD
jgi:beta-glucosidase